MPAKKHNNAFTSETSRIGNLTKKVNKLERDVNYLSGENQRLEEENEMLRERIEELESISSEFFQMLNDDKTISPILKSYISILKKNITRKPNGYRYTGLKEYFTLLSFMGPHYYGLLSDNMIFPSYRRTLDYKKKFLDAFQITDDLFDGSIENIIQIIQKFLPSDFDGKAVIMVDAASVTPYVKIHQDGTVDGIIGCDKVDLDEVQKLIADENELCKFIQSNADNVIQAEFGITFAPLSPEYKSFPIACLQATSGKATLELVDFIETLIIQLRQFYNIVGLGTDGDNSYHKYSDNFVASLIAHFDSIIDMNIIEIIDELLIMMHFSDPYHLVKRDRYRKVSKLEFCVSPLNLDCTRNVSNLEEIGIPSYILDDNKGRKMEDGLPKKLFSFLNIQKVLEIEDYPLLISMIPSTLLMECLHNDGLSRQTTIDYLLFGASIIFIFYCLSNYVIENKAKSLENRIDEYKEKMCFTTEWSEEYIFTTMNIAYLVSTEENIDVGSCSSHDQEHVFGNIRRHSKNDNTHSRFIKSMKYILLEKELYNELGIEETIPNSRSDSGRSICGGNIPEFRQFGYYLLQAKRLWSNIVDFPEDCIISLIETPKTKMSTEELMQLFECFSPKIGLSISTKSTGMIKTGGLSNARIWNAMEQMEELLDEDDSE